MGKYEYKETGIEWLGEIPKHWKVVKLKRVLNTPLMYGANEAAEFDDRELPRYIRITDFGNDGRLREDTFKSLPIENAKGYMLSHGDVLFARSGATVGKTFQFKNYNGEACFAGYLIKATPRKWQLDSDFLYLYTKSIAYEEWKNLIFTQATIQNIGADKYQYLDITLPPPPEQKAIAEYLDKACHRIDKIIEIKERQLEKIEAYFSSKLQEILSSGVEENTLKRKTNFDWFSEIPKHWKVVRLKHILSKANGGVTPKGGATSYVDEGVPLIRSQNIRFDKLDLSDVVFITKDTHDKMSNSKLEYGDVLLNITGASLGRCYYYDCENDANVNQHVCILRPFQFIRTKFLYYVLRSEIGQAQIFSGFKGSGREGLSAETIKKFSIPLPTKEEQKVIENHIDILNTNIQALKDKIYNQITTLQSYRKSLIHECVTGKKQVWEGEIKY